MHSVSSTYQTIVNSADHWFETIVYIGGTPYSGDQLISVVTRANAFGSNNLELGHAESREIELSLFGRSSSIPRNAAIEVYVRAVSANGSQGSEWIPKGRFYIDTRSKDSQTINGDEVIDITGFDSMMKAEVVFDDNDFPYSWKDAGKGDAWNLVQIAANKIGVSIESWTRSIISENNFQILLPTSYTVREGLKYVAALYGGSFIMSDTNELQLVCPWHSTGNYNLAQNAQGLTVLPPHSACTGVRMIVKNEGYRDENGDELPEEYFAGYESGYVFEIYSPWGTQAQVNWLYGQLSNYVYNPYQVATGELDPKVEIGDTITVDTVTSGVYSQEITFGTYFTSDFGAPGEEEIDHEYSYESSSDRKYSRRLYNAEAMLSIHSDEIMARVTKESPDGQTDFWWKLLDDRFEVGTGSKTVFKVDSSGGYFDGDGTFTGSLISGEIYIPSEEDYNFKVDRSGRMEAKGCDVSGTIRADSFYTSEGERLATSSELSEIASRSGAGYGGFYGGGSGLANVLSAADILNKAMVNNATTYLPSLHAGVIWAKENCYSPHFWVGDDFPYTDLRTHTHTIKFEENGDKIYLYLYEPLSPYDESNYKFASFSIAATTTYTDMVAALTISSAMSRIGISQSSDGKSYDIDVYIRNSDGTLLYSESDSTSDAVYWNGYYDGQDSVSYDWDAYWDGFVDCWNELELNGINSSSGYARVRVWYDDEYIYRNLYL